MVGPQLYQVILIIARISNHAAIRYQSSAFDYWRNREGGSSVGFRAEVYFVSEVDVECPRLELDWMSFVFFSLSSLR